MVLVDRSLARIRRLRPSSAVPAELGLSRRILAKLLSTRTMHGDYAWYHKKFKHEDAILTYACGKKKASSHLVHYPKAQRRFASWPQRPSTPPANACKGQEYLQQLLNYPEDFAAFLELTSSKET